MDIKRTSRKEIRSSLGPLGKDLDVAPSYLPPLLRAGWAWRFTREIIKKFVKEMDEDQADARTIELAKKLGRRF